MSMFVLWERDGRGEVGCRTQGRQRSEVLRTRRGWDAEYEVGNTRRQDAFFLGNGGGCVGGYFGRCTERWGNLRMLTR